MTTARADTATVFTTDHEELAGFYQRALDLDEPQRFGDDHIGFQVGDLYVGFDKVAEATRAGR